MDVTNGLYTTNLHQKHLANKVDHVHNATTKSAITFLYLAAFSPAISTLTNAIRKGFFKSWPGFTVEAVKKYVSNMPHVSAGRMDHIRKNIRSTKLNQVMNNIIHELKSLSNDLDEHLNSGIKTKRKNIIQILRICKRFTPIRQEGFQLHQVKDRNIALFYIHLIPMRY